MVCRSWTRDRTTTSQVFPLFSVKISTVKYKIQPTITQAELLQLHLYVHITTLYGPKKTHHRENLFQSLTNHITSNQNTITVGDFNMATEFRDRTGGAIFNTHLLGSIPLNKLLKNQNLQHTWRKLHTNKINYTYHRTLSNINSRLDRIYSSQNFNTVDSKILPSQYSGHEALFAEFHLRVRTPGPGYWKYNTSILDHENFCIAFQNFWQEWKQQQKDYKNISTWWEIGKLYFKMLATHYCAQMQKTFVINKTN